jgi:hypothetical protein
MSGRSRKARQTNRAACVIEEPVAEAAGIRETGAESKDPAAETETGAAAIATEVAGGIVTDDVSVMAAGLPEPMRRTQATHRAPTCRSRHR